MRFHWMNRGDMSSVAEISALSQKLERHGYYSLLLTYHSKTRDLLLKSFGAASNNQKLKYMLAIRTYAISPEYMSLICKAYNEEFPDKLILNIVSGDLQKDETSVEDLVWISEYLDIPEKRLNYTKDWMSKFKELSKDYYPEIFMAGHSNITRDMANHFDATHISMLDMYRDYLKDPARIINEKQLVSLSVLIRDSKAEAREFVQRNALGNGLGWTLYGTKEDVLEQIKELEELGITDILISKTTNDTKEDLVHKLIGGLTCDN
jgi:hypothetical protein